MSQTTGDQVVSGGGNAYAPGTALPGGVSQGGNNNLNAPSLTTYANNSGQKINNNNSNKQNTNIVAAAGANVNFTSSDPQVLANALAFGADTQDKFFDDLSTLWDKSQTATAALSDRFVGLATNMATAGAGVDTATGQSQAAKDQNAASNSFSKTLLWIVGGVVFLFGGILLFRGGSGKKQ